ncbi:MAG: two-component regulator propeller domain-containing protein [Paludibacter sp.]|nr:two-component regulator propeller domain-containing protein [Paludibacter sp.]
MKKLQYLTLLLIISLSVFSEKNMIVQDYTIDNGLPHNTVFSTLKDKDGFIWLGTWYGLASFDGVKFKSYNKRDDYNTDIPPHKIQILLEAPDGNLWVKTIDHKLFLFDKKNELFYDVFNEIKKKKYSVSPKIIKIQQNDSGELLLLTKNKDLLSAVSKGNGLVEIKLLYDSQSKREHKLTNNLFVEDTNYINWIGVDFKIISCKKGAELRNKPSDFISKKISLDQNQEFTCAYEFHKTLWVGDNSGNIFKIDYKKGNVTKIDLFNGLGSVQNIICLNGKNIFVSIEKQGVYEYDEKTNNSIKVFKLASSEVVTNTIIDSYDKVWFEIDQSSVIYFDPFNRLNKRFDIPKGKVNKEIRYQDGKELGMFFLGTSGDLVWFDRAKLSVSLLNKKSELTLAGEKNVYFDILLDKENILWLSSTLSGVFQVSFPKKQFNLFHFDETGQTFSSDNAVKTLFQSKNGDIWVATRSAEVFQLDKNRKVKQIFNYKNYWIGNVYHIMEDHKGNIWFSTKGNGLVKAEPNSQSSTNYNFTRYVYDENNPLSLSGNDVYYTYEDSNNCLWVALFGGGLNQMSQKDGKTIFNNKFNSFNKYPKYGLYMEVRNITEDKNGRIWVGTSDGLMSFNCKFKDPKQIDFEIYRSEKNGSNISDNDIYVLYKDAASEIWVSVFGGGLNKLESYDEINKIPVFKSYSLKEGQTSDVIVSIVEDNENALWLVTENSLTKFDKTKETFRNFDRYDGLPYVQMEQESSIKLDNGELWFGNRMGILSFNPQKIETYSFDYKTFIVNFQVSNKDIRSFKEHPILKESIRYAKSITLKHNQSTFVIEFAALNYYNQNRISYKYILKGFEDEWHFNGKNRIASYPNIPPGKYVFVVQSVDEANISFISERMLEINILPPWWFSWIAYVIYSIITLLIIYGVFRAVLFYIRVRNDIYVEQRVSEMKIKFFTNISHELRTPLTLIMGPIQELKQKQQLNDKGLQYVSMIEKNAGQMLQLVNQILDFRKIQNGKMILHVSQLELNSLIDSFQKEFSLLAEEKEISFNFQLADEDISIWADKEKLEIVIRNLLSNAFKFTLSGGSIYVTAGLKDNGEKCFVRVDDTGVGISQGKISEIFERFFQSDNSKNAYFPGTGIGLALSKEIVSLHHGTIHVESKVDQGSVFTVELLLGKDHYNPSEVNFYVGDTITEIEGEVVENSEFEELPILNDENKKDLPILLVVEDNKDLCNLLRMQLDDKYKVYMAGNGVEGLKKVHLYHPDIVVTDQMMPEMTGTEMLKKMRDDFQISHIPVIILTAKNDDEEKIKAISMGANSYITKPFSKEYLIATIEQLLSDRKVFRDKIWTLKKLEENDKNDTYENYLQKKDIEFLEKIHHVIEENLDNSDFNIDSIADTLGISRSAFFKKLKSITGLAPVDMIKEIRLTKSVELLKSTDLTISEIAFAVGFKDSGYYGKCFRKKYGQTASEYMSKFRLK